MKNSYWFTRFLFLRALGFIYLIAFLVAWNQFVPLLGSHGIFPVGNFLQEVSQYHGSGLKSFWEFPSLFWLKHSDFFLQAMAGVGVGLSFLLLVGLADSFLLFALWALYLSFVNVGQLFYGYGWEMMVLETGFLAIFLPPILDPRPFPKKVPPSLIVMWCVRWELFRTMFGAGLIKLRGDECWRDLTCLEYHFETQPIPNPLSWYLHQLPPWVLKGGVLFNHFAELIAPWFLFGPRRIRQAGALVIMAFQFVLILSGNLSWLNFLTIVLCIPCFDDEALQVFFPKTLRERVKSLAANAKITALRKGILSGLACLVILLSLQPALNLFSSQQLMNFSFDPLHLVNTYGAFGSVGQVRNEVILEGTSDEELTEQTQWKEYQFKCKPGDVARRPCLVSPYHLRIDWQIWFAAMEDPNENDWLLGVMEKILQGNPAILSLLDQNPFPGSPPRYLRAMLYEYHFTKRGEATKDWWTRKELGTYFPPVRLRE